MTNLKIKTIVRLRPTLAHEPPDNGITIPDDTSIAVVNPRDPVQQFKYNFKSVYGPQSTQEDLWKRDVQELVGHIWEGLSVTVFAYGVTSSGKTHTIQGHAGEPGIIPRVVDLMFTLKKPDETLSMSYMEIYCDEVYDLLAGGVNSPKLPVREDRNGKVVVQNLSEVVINSPANFKSVFAKANGKRAVGPTNLNSASSRSHAILCLNVTRVVGHSTYTGTINLVDLAGSENNKLTGNDHARMLESAAINKSLATLGQVVHALNQSAHRIPYRDSKLTRILQDALGGSSIGLLICNLAPGPKFRTDTLNTLNFAARTKEVENRPSVNEKDNRPAPKAHFAAVQQSKRPSIARGRVSIRLPAATAHSLAANSFTPPSLERPMKRSSRPSSRLSLLPVPALSRGLLRATTHDEPETRTKEREEIERRVRQELAADMKNLEAKMELEKKERELELAKEAAMMREKELQETLEAERALLRQRQKEAEEQMQKEQEEMWKRAQEEMEARIARAVEEEVAKRLEAINMKSAESSKVEQGVAGPSRTVTPSTSGTLEPPPAYDPDSEVKRRLDALEQRYALQNSDQALTRALSPRSKKKQAHAYLELAREYHLEKEDYENALYFYKRAQQYVPDNAKLKVRIEEMQLAIESKNKGLPFGGVKRTRAAASRHQALPEYLSAENDDNDDDNDAETNGDDATDVFLANRARPADRTRSKVKKQRETVLQEGSKANEGGDEAMDIEVKLECGVEGSPEKPARKKRLVSISKGKNRWDLDESSEEENEPDLVEEKVRGAARRKGKKARKGRV